MFCRFVLFIYSIDVVNFLRMQIFGFVNCFVRGYFDTSVAPMEP